MKRPLNRNWPMLAAVFGLCAAPACAPPPSDGALAVGDGAETAEILPSNDGLTQFAVAGTTSDFRQYMALGELTLVARDDQGTFDGTGVAVLGTEYSDQIVADVTALIHDGGTSDFTFHWRDSVTLADGREFSNTGRFLTTRPAGLALSSIRPATSCCAFSPGSECCPQDDGCRSCCCTSCSGVICTFSCGRRCCGDTPGGCYTPYNPPIR